MTRDLPPLPDSLAFLRLLWAVDHQLARRSKRMARDLGVTGSQRVVVRLLGLVPSADATTLARWTNQDPSTLTGVLARLLRDGLIVGRRDPADARRTLYELTDRGRAIDASHEGTIESAVAAALADLEPETVASVRVGLERLAARLAEESA